MTLLASQTATSAASTGTLIPFCIVMMMLSFISERAANFLKLYFQGKKITILYPSRPFFRSVRIELLSYEQPTESGEKEREVRVLIINIIIGILVASLANANFFQIVKDISSPAGPQQLNLGWRNIKGYNVLPLIGGLLYMALFLWSCSLLLFNRLLETKRANKNGELSKVAIPFICWGVITLILMASGFWGNGIGAKIVLHTLGYVIIGFFLSLGSKFWHDLLDILYQFKNTKEVLSDQRTYADSYAADQVATRATISRYQVAEKLYDKYKGEILQIESVVSHGLTTRFDEKSKEYIKVIEVEYTSSKAQDALDKLALNGSIEIQFNTFHLIDYLQIVHTSKLIALANIEISGGDLADLIKTKTPVCYAYNENEKSKLGSFGLLRSGNELYAVGNAHVFLDSQELYSIVVNNFDRKLIQHTSVILNIGDHDSWSVEIEADSVKLYNNPAENGLDFCRCKIQEKDIDDVLSTYNALIKVGNATKSTYTSFGAASKYFDFFGDDLNKATVCTVGYDNFSKDLNLFKIQVYHADFGHINFGDSGSIVNYFETESKSVEKGMIVAKSDNYAYMFKLRDVFI